jgi:hypothetical protein
MSAGTVAGDFLGKKLSESFMRVQHFGPVRNVLLGGGMAYAIAEEKYLHLPVALVFPSIYAGYQGYKQRERVAGFVRSLQARP